MGKVNKYMGKISQNIKLFQSIKLFSFNFLTEIIFEFIMKKNKNISEVKYGHKKTKPDDTHCKNAL